MYPTPPQLRAARALLNLKQEEIARRASLSARTVISAEQGKTARATSAALMAAYMELGVRFDGTPDGKRLVVIYDAETVYSAEPVTP
jgi:transcriptional regulator with XRE-family HTH domain